MDNETKYVGFWWRYLEWMIDGNILGALLLLLVTILNPFAEFIPEEGVLNAVAFLLSMFLFFSLPVLYWSILESYRWQGSIGKRILGFRVVDKGGNRISFRRALGRNVVKTLCFIPPFPLLFLGVAIHSRKQGVHDLAAETFVIRRA